MLRLSKEDNELNIVGDQIGCPTYSQDIASTIVQIIPQLHSQKDYGLFHYCGNTPCIWYDFAKAIFEQAKTNNLKIPSTINSIKTSAYPTPAKRPVFSVLDCSKIENDFGVHASNWHDGIGQVISKLKLENPVS